jgi:hypothetical protein
VLENEGYAHWIVPPDRDELCLRARAALAQPEPQGPTDEELIATITEVSDMSGIAQRHPNINLNDFKDQMCIVKWSNGKVQYDKVWCDDEEESSWSICLTEDIYSDGRVCGTASLYITEIYGEGAYEIKTKETFDEPTDEAVQKAKEAIKDLSEEQIAKLLHSLKND